MKTGLVLEGGGLRCMFTAGITDVMMENGVTFDGIIGVSAGATFGCNYKSEQPGRVLRYQKRFAPDDRFMSLRSLWETGDYVNAEFAYHEMPTELDIFDFDAYRANPAEFYAVCTDVLTGEPIYHRIDDMTHSELDWLRASASMPIVSRPVEVDDRTLLDGGIADSIPLRKFQEMGYERNVVIMTQPVGFTKKKTSLMPLFHIFMRKQPAIVRAMERRHVMYNEQLAYVAEQEKLGNTLVIQPEAPLNIGRTERNVQKIQEIYDLGRATGEKYLNTIKQFIAK